MRAVADGGSIVACARWGCILGHDFLLRPPRVRDWADALAAGGLVLAVGFARYSDGAYSGGAANDPRVFVSIATDGRVTRLPSLSRYCHERTHDRRCGAVYRRLDVYAGVGRMGRERRLDDGRLQSRRRARRGRVHALVKRSGDASITQLCRIFGTYGFSPANGARGGWRTDP